MAAASLGFGRETYTYPPPASVCFLPDGGLVGANNNCFLQPVAMADDDYFPELGVHPPDDYHSPPPYQVFTASKNEMNMSYVVDDGRMTTTTMMSGAAGGGHDLHRRPLPPPSSRRIGFRTRSEVDVLDDGFRWRKYGKKAVKSSPNPRNYYRCSAEGCAVKKRVERDSDDPRYVVTTYDGVHNHAAAPVGCAGACTGTAGRRQQAAPYAAATTALAPPSDVWGTMQQHLLHSAATAHSSESSY